MTPSKLDYAKKEISRFVVTVTERDDQDEPLGFVLERNSLVGESYKMYLCSKDRELEQYLYAHECGHIIFGHVENADIKASILSPKIKKVYEKHSELFGTSEELFEYVRHHLYNIAMDLEVNSKLFTVQDMDDFEMLVSRLAGDEAHLCRYDVYGYPPERDWKTYLMLILEDFDKFVEDDKKRLGASSDKDYLDAIKEEVQAELSSNKEKIAESYGDTHRDPERAVVNESLSFDEVAAIIYRNIFNLKPVENRRDMMYNYNRKKLNSSILIPKTLAWNEYRQRTFYILFDISGSVDSEILDKTYAMLSKMPVSDKSRIIFCDTKVCGDFLVRDKQYLTNGGGTYLAAGLEYIREKYAPKSDSILFVMSDFQDSLDRWTDELKLYKTKNIYGVEWGNYGFEDTSRVKKLFKSIWRIRC